MNSSIVLTPVLKKPESTTVSTKNSVTFNIPDETTNIVEYLKQSSLEGSFKKQDDFIKNLLSDDTEESVLVNWVKQFKDNIFFLDKENERITSALLAVNWTQKSEEFSSVYQELVLNLVSAHTMYLSPVLSMIIKVFSTVLVENDEISIDENHCYQQAHKLLQNITKLVPSAPHYLCLLLAEQFPYFRKSTHLISRYGVNVLNICTYLPSQRLTMLTDLIDKILLIDVYCPRNTIELWEIEKEEAEEENIMELDTTPTEDQSTNMAFPLANTLDLLMQNFFIYLECSCSVNGKELNWEVTKKLFREMLTVFDKLILPTYQCSHVQFLMFYMCSWKPALCEGFLDYLWKKVKDPNTAPVRRQAASFYIGSLLARASYISISTVTACFDLMCHWVHSYINNCDSRNSCDVSAHGTFHCVCQMLFYVFAFRHREFINMKNGFKYLQGLNFDRIIACKLNPLKFCQPTIVQNFASVARNYQIAYCYPVIERNNRSLVLGIIHADNFAAMNTYFPFDPYQLKRSKKWIDPIYRKYEVHENEDSICAEDEEIVESSDPPTPNSATFSYGSSPGFKKFMSTTSSKVR